VTNNTNNTNTNMNTTNTIRFSLKVQFSATPCCGHRSDTCFAHRVAHKLDKAEAGLHQQVVATAAGFCGRCDKRWLVDFVRDRAGRYSFGAITIQQQDGRTTDRVVPAAGHSIIGVEERVIETTESAGAPKWDMFLDSAREVWVERLHAAVDAGVSADATKLTRYALSNDGLGYTGWIHELHNMVDEVLAARKGRKA
jgi:hypothetical protein